MEKRHCRRELYLQAITYVPDNNPAQKNLKGSMINISLSGACVFTFDRLIEGQKIVITKGLPESNTLQTCSVRWAEKMNDSLYKAGLMFLSVTSSGISNA